MSALIVVSGPSGVGKGTLVRRVLNHFPQLEIGLSWTTRKPRRGDAEGTKQYRYVTRDEFMEAVERGEFLEWAEYSGNLYGSWKGEGQHTLLEIETQGALQVAMATDKAFLVGVLPPGDDLDQKLAVIEQRLLGRDTEAADVARQRLAIAPNEIAAIERWWPHIIINDDVVRASQELIDLVEPQLC